METEGGSTQGDISQRRKAATKSLIGLGWMVPGNKSLYPR